MVTSIVEFAEIATNCSIVTKYPSSECYFADVFFMDIISLNFEI